MASPPRGGRSAREICREHITADAEGDRRLAGRKYRSVLPSGGGFLQDARAGGEGDRRRRFRAGHQGSRSDRDRAALTRGDPEGRGRLSYRLKLAEQKVRLPEAKRKKGPRYTP